MVLPRGQKGSTLKGNILLPVGKISYLWIDPTLKGLGLQQNKWEATKIAFHWKNSAKSTKCIFRHHTTKIILPSYTFCGKSLISNLFSLHSDTYMCFINLVRLYLNSSGIYDIYLFYKNSTVIKHHSEIIFRALRSFLLTFQWLYIGRLKDTAQSKTSLYKLWKYSILDRLKFSQHVLTTASQSQPPLLTNNKLDKREI